MPTVKYKVILEQQEREALQDIVKKGKGGAFKIRRAQILLHSDHNSFPTCAAEIAQMLHYRQGTVDQVRK